MQFSTIPGYARQILNLTQMVQEDRLPHALLLAGPEGNGKLAIALALAQYVLCRNKSDHDSCGTCPSCSKATRFIHPDIHFSFPVIGANVVSDMHLPEWRQALGHSVWMSRHYWATALAGDKEGGNKQLNINKEECNKIIQKLSFKSFESGYKILIQWLPEHLGNEGNRLLKLIEEPPAKTLIIFVAEQTEQILPTLLSRCQLVKVPAFGYEEIWRYLSEQQGVSESEAQTLAFMSDGNLFDAIQMSETRTTDEAGLFLDWLRTCYKGVVKGMLEQVEVLCEGSKEAQKQFLFYGIHFFGETLKQKLSKSLHVQLHAEAAKTAENLAGILDVDQIDRMLQLLNDRFFYVERNANEKLLFLDLSIKMKKVFRREDFVDIFESPLPGVLNIK
jgi:DNA polymerase-3 subunit delta'